MKYKSLLVVLVLAVTLQACSFSGAGDTYNKNPTVGQELIDLERARSLGVISESEFIRLKDEIIK